MSNEPELDPWSELHGRRIGRATLGEPELDAYALSPILPGETLDQARDRLACLRTLADELACREASYSAELIRRSCDRLALAIARATTTRDT